MANCCPTAGVVLALLSMAGIIYCLASKEWKINSQLSSQSNLYGIYSYEGLWVRCVSPIPGQFQCDQFDESFLSLPVELQAQRAMMCLATICAVGGVIAGAVGLECIQAMKASKGKRWTGRSGGILMILAGILTIATASWYAADLIWEYHVNVDLNAAFSYELGSALYIAWISGGLALIAGILLACCTCGDGDEEDEDASYRYTYKPPVAKPARSNTEYV